MLGSVSRECNAAVIAKIDSITLSFPKCEQAASPDDPCISALAQPGPSREARNPLLLQHHLSVGVFESLQLGQVGKAEQVLRQRLVGQQPLANVANSGRQRKQVFTAMI